MLLYRTMTLIMARRLSLLIVSITPSDIRRFTMFAWQFAGSVFAVSHITPLFSS